MGGRDTNIQEPDATTLFESTRCLRQRLAANIETPMSLPTETPSSVENNSVETDFNTTHFADDAPVRQASVISTSIPRDLGPPTTDVGSIKDFLAKPIRFGTFSYTTGSAVNSVLYTADLTSYLTSVGMYRQKIAGYQLIRGCWNIKLVLNADPFQSGRLILHFLPCFRHYSSTWRAARNLNLCAVTQTPNIEMDVRDTDVELCIPYVSPFPYANRGSNGDTYLYDWGTIWVRPMTSLLVGSGGSTSITGSVYVSLHDVELASCRYGPESGKGELSKEAKSVASSGIISSATDALGTIAGALGSTSLGLALNRSAKLMSAFGYSKPINMTVPHIVVRNPLRGLQLGEGSDQSEPLSISARPQIESNHAIFGTKVDDKSIAFLKKVPAWRSTYTWTTSDAVAAVLVNEIISPWQLKIVQSKVSGPNTATYETYPPFVYLTKIFSQWRGGIRITLKFVKTIYHSGRLLITFWPSGESPGSSLDHGVYVFREIVDIRDKNEITLDLPYMRPELWVDSLENAPGIGRLQVTVLNPLRAPVAAPSSVPILAYYSGADNFEVAGPTASQGIVFSPESGVGDLVVKPIGNSVSMPISDSHNANTHGDPIVSLKQVLNCARLLRQTNLSNTSGAFFPNTHAIATYTSGLVINASSTPGMDLLDHVCSGFAFKRGSVRIIAANEGVGSALLVRSTTNNSFSTLASLGLADSFNSTLSVTTARIIGNQIISPMVTSRQLDVTVPYYNATPISLCDFSGPSATSKPVLPDSSNTMLAYNFASSSTQWFRSGGDDFDVGYFIGFLPLLVSIV